MSESVSPEQLFTALHHVAPKIKENHGVDQCILLTRVAVAACDKAGMPAKGLAVEVALASNQDPTVELVLGRPGVQLGNDMWDGHLVCVMDRRVLVDLTIDQAANAAIGFHPEPFAVQSDQDFLKGGKPRTVPFNGGQARYTALPHRRDFKDQPGWKPWTPEELDRLADKIVEIAEKIPSE